MVAEDRKAGIWNALLMSKHMGNDWPYSNEAFQCATGLGPLGFADPDFRLNGILLTQSELECIKGVETQADSNPSIFREGCVDNIEGLRQYNGLVRRHYNKVPRPQLLKILRDRGATFRQALDEPPRQGNIPRARTPDDFARAVLPALADLLFGEEWADERGTFPDCLERVVHDMYYRLWDTGRKNNSDFEKRVKKRRQELDVAMDRKCISFPLVPQ